MKTASAKTESQKPESILQAARLRVELAESRCAETKELARAARRQRKAAKAIAREAKKAAKKAKEESRQAKEVLAKARVFLAEAEAELAPPAVPVAKARKGRSASTTVTASTETLALDPEDKAAMASAPPATMVEKLPEVAPPGALGNWR